MPSTTVLVVPPEVLAASSVVERCGLLVLGVRGEFAGLDLQGACGGVAGVAFGQMTAAWLGELARLSEQASALAGYLGAAADDYVRTDRFVFAAPSTVSHP